MDWINKVKIKYGGILSLTYEMRWFPYVSIELIRLGSVRAISFGIFKEKINVTFEIQ